MRLSSAIITESAQAQARRLREQCARRKEGRSNINILTDEVKRLRGVVRGCKRKEEAQAARIKELENRLMEKEYEKHFDNG